MKEGRRTHDPKLASLSCYRCYRSSEVTRQCPYLDAAGEFIGINRFAAIHRRRILDSFVSTLPRDLRGLLGDKRLVGVADRCHIDIRGADQDDVSPLAGRDRPA